MQRSRARCPGRGARRAPRHICCLVGAARRSTGDRRGGRVTALPEMNALVRVALDDDGLVLPSRVEDIDNGDLLLAAAAFVGDVEGPKPGSAVSVHWTSPRGICSVSGEFVERERSGSGSGSGMRLWRVRPAGDVE